ncbi:hypothetical protein Dsin_019220 [Dipteronia sinensis]|uniref:RNase H type-1 domain-containing protein n=1 Tax=Dipteronia sinensis TaxID=43782 RepID=A0AAE0A7L4_9ROSI|nr:hypothetical protein Dsin_019220 [Dipteronia sinensis]
MYMSNSIQWSEGDRLTSIIGVKHVRCCERYLGLPSLNCRNKWQLFYNIKDHVWTKINGWKGKLMSIGGKNKFYGSWQKICVPKDECGLGFLDPKTFNLALIAKQCLRCLKNSLSLADRLLKNCYFPKESFLNASPKSKGSLIWQGLLWRRGIINMGSWWRIGSGNSVRICSDQWIPRPLTFKFISSHLLDDNATVDSLKFDLVKNGYSVGRCLPAYPSSFGLNCSTSWNQLVHNLEVNGFDNVDMWASNFLEKWNSAQHIDNPYLLDHELVVKWIHSKDGVWNINTYATTCYQNQTLGLGIIIPNKSEVFKVVASLNIQAMFTPRVAEAMAVWQATTVTSSLQDPINQQCLIDQRILIDGSRSDNVSFVPVEGTSSIPVISVTIAVPTAQQGLTDITSYAASVVVVSEPKFRL